MISALTASAIEAYALGDALREQGVATVFGGLHATAVPEECLLHFDAVAVGDGEATFSTILDDVAKGELGGVYRASRAANLSNWVMPRFDLLPNDAPRYTIQTQRGCPWNCEFCAASKMLGGYREKPVERVAAELTAIKEVARRPRIELADDNTFARRDDADGLLDVLEHAELKWFTESDWRVGERPEVLSRLANAGCVQMLVGLESQVFQYPGFGRKQAEFDRVVEACLAIQDAGVPVNACFILGADGETEASIDRLVEYLLEAPFAEVQLTLQTPFPGAGLHERLHREGRLLEERDWSYYTLFDVTYRPDKISVATLEKRFRKAIGTVFGASATRRREAIRRNVMRKPHCEPTVEVTV